MDFPTHQAHARGNTAKLVALGLFGLGGIIAATGVLTLGLIYWITESWRPMLAVAIATPFTTLTVATIAAGKSYLIRDGGGRYVARSLGGREVDFNTRDPRDRKLVNVIEEIAVASGTPAPAVFVLDAEPGINAFAAGWNVDNAAIGVTRGALHHLSRNELQGVMAHEFSHIVNGDTRAKTRIIGWVFGITAIYSIGRLLFDGAAGGNRPNPFAVPILVGVGMGLCAIGYGGSVFAGLIQAAVSRQREYLADASAVQYTRDPSGIGEALKKTGGIAEHGRLVSATGRETNHLFFASAFGGLRATHPSLQQRIRRLLPHWDGIFTVPETARPAANGPFTAGGWVDVLPTPAELPGIAEAGVFAGALAGSAASGPAGQVVGGLLRAETFRPPAFEGPTAEHIEYARSLLAQIPEETQVFLRTQGGAVAAVVGLLVSPGGQNRSAELVRAASLTGFDPEYLDQAGATIAGLDRQLHLPAIDMALHAIQETPEDFRTALAKVVRAIDSAQPDKDLFGWMLRRVLLRHLDDQYDDGSVVHRMRFEQLHVEASVVFAVIAWFNSSGVCDAQHAFDAATAAAHCAHSPILSMEVLDVERVDHALDALAGLNYSGRQRFVIGATAAVLHDNKTTADEAELIRVVADAVRLPMPPLLPA